MKLLEGKYGNYVTDGETNATVPKDVTPEALTFDQALNLLAERAARGPSKKSRRKPARAAAPKAARAKKVTKAKVPAGENGASAPPKKKAANKTPATSPKKVARVAAADGPIDDSDVDAPF